MANALRLRLTANKKIFVSIILLASFTAAVTFGAIPIRYPELGLDESWQQALVDATDTGRIFGDSFVFTYGPFHQAVTSQASEYLSALLTSRALFALTWFGITALIGFNNGLPSAIAIAISAALLGVWHAGPPGDAKFYLFSLIAIIASQSTWSISHERVPVWRKSILSIMLAIGVLLSTLVKLSFLGAAIPAMLSIYGFQILSLFRSPTKKAIFSLLVSLAAPILLLYSLWGLFVSWSPSAIVSYYTGLNLDIVTGYTDAMSYNVSIESLILALLYWTSILVNLAFYELLFMRADYPESSLHNYFKPDSFLAAISLILLSWISFKAAYVRDDGLHVVLAGMFIISFTIMLAGFKWDQLCKIFRNQDKVLFFIASFPLVCISLIITVLAGGYRPPNLISTMAKGLLDSTSMITGSGRKTIAKNRRDKLKEIQVNSEDYLISPGSSADIIPWDITNLLANQLVYKPRPIPQSYSAYTESLQKANKDFFLSSPDRPEFVIIEAKDIDGRLPIGLDSASLAAIKDHYSFSHRGSQDSLVFKLGNSKKTNPTLNKESTCKLNGQALSWRPSGRLKWYSDDVNIPKNRIGYLTLTTELKNSLSRSLLSAAYRPFPVMIEYLDAQQNVVERFRFIPKAGTQIVTYPIIRDNGDLFDFLTSNKAVNAPGSPEIRSFRLSTRSLGIPFKASKYSLEFSC